MGGKDIYIQQSTLGHIRESHRHHEGRERKRWGGGVSNSLILFATIL